MIGLVLVILMIALVTGAELWSEERATEAWQWKNDVRLLVRDSRKKRQNRPLRWASYRQSTRAAGAGCGSQETWRKTRASGCAGRVGG